MASGLISSENPEPYVPYVLNCNFQAGRSEDGYRAVSPDGGDGFQDLWHDMRCFKSKWLLTSGCI